jgi:DNA polymerase-1
MWKPNHRQEDNLFVNNSKEEKMIEFYKMEGADGHSFVAKLCFPEELGNTPLEEVKRKFPKLRQIAKSAKFAIHYSGTGFTIARNLNLSEEEGNRIEKAYLTAFPQIHKYLKDMKTLATKKGFILISPITGRKYWAKDFNRLSDRELYKFSKLSANYPIQGQSAEVTKIGVIYLFNWIMDNNYFNIVKMANQVHDEVLLECPIDMTDIVADKLKECLELGAKKYTPLVPLKASVEISNHWKH